MSDKRTRPILKLVLKGIISIFQKKYKSSIPEHCGYISRWADLPDRTPPASLILSAVYFSPDLKTNLLPEPVIVAQVLKTPAVEKNEGILYQSASNELRIKGSGFIGAKKVDISFKPPLVKEVAYEDVSRYPLSQDTVVLRKRHNYNWRDTPGELSIVSIDTGGGPVKLNGDDGVVVAKVEKNLDPKTIQQQYIEMVSKLREYFSCKIYNYV